MKRILLSLLLILGANSLHAGIINIYSYDPSKLLGTEYANDFRRARQDGQPVFVSISHAKRLIKQCRPAQINKQVISTSQDDNFLSISKHGNVSVQMPGSNMMIAPSAPGDQQINLNPESGVIYYLHADHHRPNGLFVMAFESGGQMD